MWICILIHQQTRLVSVSPSFLLSFFVTFHKLQSAYIYKFVSSRLINSSEYYDSFQIYYLTNTSQTKKYLQSPVNAFPDMHGRGSAFWFA